MPEFYHMWKDEADPACRTFVRSYVTPPDPCLTDANCINVGKIPLLKNMRATLIDPDTPKSALTKKASDGSTLNLVVRQLSHLELYQLTLQQFSDEFNKDGRTFYAGDDPFFTAVDLWYGVTQDMEVRLWFPNRVVTAR